MPHVAGHAILHLITSAVGVYRLDDTRAIWRIGRAQKGTGDFDRPAFGHIGRDVVADYRRLTGRTQIHRHRRFVAVQVVWQRTGVTVVDLVFKTVGRVTPAETGIDFNAPGIDVTQIAATEVGIPKRRVQCEVAPDATAQFLDLAVVRQIGQRIRPAGVGSIRIVDIEDARIEHLDMRGLRSDARREFSHREVRIGGNRGVVDVVDGKGQRALRTAHLAIAGQINGTRAIIHRQRGALGNVGGGDHHIASRDRTAVDQINRQTVGNGGVALDGDIHGGIMKVGNIPRRQISGRKRGDADPVRAAPAPQQSTDDAIAGGAVDASDIGQLGIGVINIVPLKVRGGELHGIENTGQHKIRRRHAVAAVGILLHQCGAALILRQRPASGLRDGRRVIDRRQRDRHIRRHDRRPRPRFHGNGIGQITRIAAIMYIDQMSGVNVGLRDVGTNAEVSIRHLDAIQIDLAMRGYRQHGIADRGRARGTEHILIERGEQPFRHHGAPAAANRNRIVAATTAVRPRRINSAVCINSDRNRALAGEPAIAVRDKEFEVIGTGILKVVGAVFDQTGGKLSFGKRRATPDQHTVQGQITARRVLTDRINPFAGGTVGVSHIDVAGARGVADTVVRGPLQHGHIVGRQHRCVVTRRDADVDRGGGGGCRQRTGVIIGNAHRKTGLGLRRHQYAVLIRRFGAVVIAKTQRRMRAVGQLRLGKYKAGGRRDIGAAVPVLQGAEGR